MEQGVLSERASGSKLFLGGLLVLFGLPVSYSTIFLILLAAMLGVLPELICFLT